MGEAKRRKEAAHAVQPGEHIEVEIHDIGHKGEGVGRFEGLVAFVPGAAPGDRVRARVTEVRKGYVRAELVQILVPSADRVAPPCPVAGTCGGCQLQHIRYERQLELKRQAVAASLARIGKLQGVTVHPTLGMDHPWAYRNKGQFPVGQSGGQVVIGFFAPGTHRIVDIEQCAIQHPLANRVLAAVRALAAELGVPVYDERSHTGVLRHVLTRVARGTGEAMVVLVTRTPEFPQGRRMAERLMEEVPGVVSVVQNINPERTNVVLGPRSVVLAGRDHITDYIGDLAFTISPVSFFQVNPAQTEVLYATALAYAALTGTETVIDLYCGIGTISLFLARAAARVIGIEWVEEAVRDAWRNAERNGVSNVRFIAGDAAVEMPRLAAEGVTADVIVLDPPRKGCDPPVLEALAAMRPERVVYVSCNPASLARDLARLSELGYRTVEVQPVDMFPHTAHVECCARLVRT